VSQLFKIRYIITSILLFCLLCFLLLLWRSSIILNTFNKQFRQKLKPTVTTVNKIASSEKILNSFSKFAAASDIKTGKKFIQNTFAEDPNIETAVLFKKNNKNNYKKLLYYQKNNDIPVKIISYSFTNQIPLFKYKKQLYYVINRRILDIFNTEKGRITAVININDFFNLISFRRVKTSGNVASFKQFSGWQLPGTGQKLALSFEDFIVCHKTSIDNKTVIFKTYYAITSVFLYFLVFHIFIVVLIRVNNRYKLLIRFFKKTASIFHISEKALSFFGSFREEINPIVRNLQNDIYELKKEFQYNVNRNNKPDSHLDVKESSNSEKNDLHLEQEEIDKHLQKSGKKTAMIDVDDKYKKIIYNFNYDEAIQKYNEDKFKLPQDMDNNSQKFKNGKAKMIDSREEKKLIFNKNLKDKLIKIKHP